MSPAHSSDPSADCQYESSVLAQELIDIIIDNLHDDLRSLASCTLVSRSWSSRSSYHLCRRISVKIDRHRCFMAFVQSLNASSRLSWTVQELVLKGVYEQEQVSNALSITSLLHAVSALPKLRVLELHGVSFKPSQVPIAANHPPAPLPRPSLDALRIRGYNIPDGLTDVMALFDSITSLETNGLCWASVRPAYVHRHLRTSVRSIVSLKSDPSALSSVVEQLQGCVLPEHVHLTMDDGIFALTYLANEFNQLLRDVGQCLGEIEFNLSPRILSMVASDLPLGSLASCINLQSLSICFELGLDQCAVGRNAVSFAILCDIIHSACSHTPPALDCITTTIVVNLPQRADESKDPVLASLRRLSWGSMQDDLEIFGQKRQYVPPQRGFVFRLVASKETEESISWLADELRDILERSLSSRARRVVRVL